LAVTIKDIARLAGVSVTTVSKIVNGKDQDISAPTREKVQNLIKEHKYSPNKVAQSMVTKETKTIGLVIPDVRNPFFTEIARGVEDQAIEKGYSVIICNTDDDLKKEIMYIEMLAEKRVDGLILAPAILRNENLEKEVQVSTPIVLIDRETSINGIKGKICIDNFQGAYDAVKCLIDLSNKDILFFSGPINEFPSKDRLAGYKKALEDNGIDFNMENVYIGDFKRNWSEEKINQLVATGKSFTSVFCGNDLIAIDVIKALQKNGKKVPDDVSIIGFDDSPIATVINPELTTIRQPSYEIGSKSVELLLNSINEKASSYQEIQLKHELIIRNSTK
jgi:LacI family transcriptional regulator